MAAGRPSPYRRFLSGYYVCNVLNLLSWLWLRTLVDEDILLAADELTGFTFEAKMLLGVVMLLCMKYLNSGTADQFLGTLFVTCKFPMLVILGISSPVLGILFAIVQLGMMIIFPQPRFSGPTKVEQWVAAQFRTQAELQGWTPAAKKKHQEAVVVMMYTSWADTCAQLMPMYASLSLDMTEPGILRFAKLNIGRAHKVAKDYDISTSTQSKQLPTFILFEHGKEVARLPQLGSGGKVVKVAISQSSLVEELGLNVLVETSRARKTPVQEGSRKKTQ